MELKQNKVYCPICKKEMKWNKTLQKYNYNCQCYGNKRFKYTLRWCNNCNAFRRFYNNLKESKCVYEANNNWRKENPELSRRIASNGAKALAKKNKENFSKEDWLNWTKKSCNSETANKSPESKKLNSGIKWCNKCQKETPHINNTCMKCHPSSGTGRKIGAEYAINMYKLGVGSNNWRKFDNNIECNNDCKNFNDCNHKIDLKNKWGWCKTAPNINLTVHPNFITKDDILYYYDKSISDYIPWEDYKLKFSRMRSTYEIDNFIKKVKNLDIFKPKQMGPADSYNINEIVQLVPTFRTQDSENWTRAKEAFEKRLLELNINWFTYIKFYIDPKTKNIRPLVIGKSGSKFVNSSGSDLSFSTDINDGPARQFLYDIGSSWDKTQVLIIKAKSEQQALFYEWKISDVYRLFES